VTRYTVRPGQPAGTVFWNVAAVVVLIAGLAAISYEIAVAVVVATFLGWMVRVFVRGAHSDR
jgi:hypothetical protein